MSRTLVCLVVLLGSIAQSCATTIQFGADVYHLDQIYGDPLVLRLVQAVADHDQHEVIEAIRLGANPNDHGVLGRISVLYIALWFENKEAFTTLLENNADPSFDPDRGAPILYLAMRKQDSFYLEELLRFGVRLYPKSDDSPGVGVDAVTQRIPRKNFQMLLDHGLDYETDHLVGQAFFARSLDLLQEMLERGTRYFEDLENVQSIERLLQLPPIQRLDRSSAAWRDYQAVLSYIREKYGVSLKM